MLSSDAIASRVNELYSAWSMKYRDDFHREKPETLFDANKTYVNKQIKFIGLYLGHMLIDQCYSKIKRFLAMQKVLPDRDKMVLHFIGGDPPEAVVIVGNLNDVDVADIHGITHFQRIFAIKGRSKKWSNHSTQRFIKSLEKDLTFDGLIGKFDYEFDENELILDCSIKAV